MQQAIQGVQDQDYEDLEHLIVIDGKEREDEARKILEKINFKKISHILCLPWPTGKDRFNGHRIYGMSGYLINGDYIAYLDEDNWWESNHISLLMELIHEEKLDWAHSLRKLVSESGLYLANDDCESLGKWREYNNNYHHVDTSCYVLRKEIAIINSPVWYRKFRDPGVMSPDMALCNILVKNNPNFQTSGAYTVNYRLGSTPGSVKLEFFQKGNTVMADRYENGFPWRRDSTLADRAQVLKEELPLREINLITFPDWTLHEVEITHTLNQLLQSVMTHALGGRLTVLVWAAEIYHEHASQLFWDALLAYLEEAEISPESQPEVYLLAGISPCRKQALRGFLAGQIVLPLQDMIASQKWKFSDEQSILLESFSRSSPENFHRSDSI